jgi:hypothetical protein
MPKVRISEKDVDRFFDDARIKELAKLSKLPENAKLGGFGESVRRDMHIYASAREPSANELHDEIKALHDASNKNNFELTRSLIENLSPRARLALNGRWEQLYPGARFPQLKDLDNIECRQAVCARITSLCRIGGKVVDGRMRPSGKPSRTWLTAYYAPEKVRNFPRWVPERQLIRNLRLTWLEATGKPAPKVVHRSKPGPFARLVRECFRLAGTTADSINLINDSGQEWARAEMSSNELLPCHPSSGERR